MTTLDPEAAQLIRRAIQLGDPGRTSVADLRKAVEHPVPFELPPSRLRGDAPLAKLLRRAMDLAEARGSEIGRPGGPAGGARRDRGRRGWPRPGAAPIRALLARPGVSGWPAARRRVGQDADAIRSDS